MMFDGGSKLDRRQSILAIFERFRRDEITREEAGDEARACGFKSLEEAEKAERAYLQQAYLQRASRDRAEIVRQVLHGKKTPEEAEEWLAKRNAVGSRMLHLPPFRSNPYFVDRSDGTRISGR